MKVNIRKNLDSLVLTAKGKVLSSDGWNLVEGEKTGFRPVDAPWYQNGGLQFWAQDNELYFSSQTEVIHNDIPYIEQLDLRFSPRLFSPDADTTKLNIEWISQVNAQAKRWQKEDSSQNALFRYETKERDDGELYTTFSKYQVNDDSILLSSDQKLEYRGATTPYHKNIIKGQHLFKQMDSIHHDLLLPKTTFKAIFKVFRSQDYSALASFAPLVWVDNRPQHSTYRRHFKTRDEVEANRAGFGSEHVY